jgi:Xaa-Pro aminopeptidase
MVTQVLNEKGLSKSKVGLEFNDLTVREFGEIKHYLPHADLTDASEVLDTVMVTKEEVEFQLLKRAAQITDTGIEAAFKAAKIGMTETELGAVADGAMRKAGSEWGWSVTGATEVGTGERTAYYHGWSVPATRKIIQRGDMITIDAHSMYNLYLSDQCTNAILGTPTPKQQNLIDAWKEAVNVLIDAMRPGVIAKEVASKTAKVLEKRGYAEHVAPLFGHGCGTSCRIPPTLSIVSEDMLIPDMAAVAVVNLTQPGVGGLRIETPLRITDKGPELFSKLPIDIFRLEP